MARRVDVEKTRRLLVTRRQQLLSRYVRERQDGQDRDRPDPGDEADLSTNDENMFFSAHFGELHRDWLRDISAALQRLVLGTYGMCIDCGEAIDPKRLRAIPEAARCAACSDIHFRQSHENRGLRM